MKTITKKQIIEFIFDFNISEYDMKRAMKKEKGYLINVANQYELSGKTNAKFYRTLITK